MIPPFDDNGYLPPGIHPATLIEIEARFGVESELRRVQMESVRWMVELAIRAGGERIILNGSFVTDIMEPNDVDCVVLFHPGQRKDPQAFQELLAGLPFLDIAVAEPADFGEFVDNIFAADRVGIPKRPDRGHPMSLQNQTELENTRAKLARLEARYEALRNEPSEDDPLREAALKSLKRYINQFKEEIARFEAHQAVPQ